VIAFALMTAGNDCRDNPSRLPVGYSNWRCLVPRMTASIAMADASQTTVY